MKNFWIAMGDVRFAEWEVSFPSETTSVQILLQFAQALLASADAERVYRIDEVPGPHAFKAGPSWNYSNFLENCLNETEMLPLFDFGIGAAPTVFGQLRTRSQLCYYGSQGPLVQTEVYDCGLLLKELRPVDVEWGLGFMDRVAPIGILGQMSHPPGDSVAGKRERPTRIRIFLNSDVWFPRVLGMLEGSQPPDPAPKRWYDNGELASCHTPRLNRFVSSVRDMSPKFRAHFRKVEPEGMAQHYASMVGDNGLILE